MNPKRNAIVTRGPWSFGTMSGSGITGCILQPTRHRRENPQPKPPFYPIQNGQLYGLNVTEPDYDKRHAEVDRLGLLYGYTQRHGRNTGRTFVMSRAARKRGYRTNDAAYLRAAARKRT